MSVLITGAAGNLGSRLARHLANQRVRVRCMVHRTPLPPDLREHPCIETVRADLASPSTLPAAVDGVATVVHFAGVLFRPRPEHFLYETNVRWFGHLLEAAIAARVARMILVSFPQVEGPTTPEKPSTDRRDVNPVWVHARTRLEEERLLFDRTKSTVTTPVVLRSATVYGPGILMVEAARRLAHRRLLGVWHEPTWYHFIQTDDFLAATAAAVLKPGVSGTYGLGDERPITIQEFLDEATQVWGLPRPWRMPWWMIFSAAALTEGFALAFGTMSPLTRDFIRLGRVPHCCDTRRMRQELLPVMKFPTFEAGKHTLGEL